MLLAMCCESSLNLQVVVCADMDLSTQSHPNGVVSCAIQSGVPDRNALLGCFRIEKSILDQYNFLKQKKDIHLC